MRYMTPRITLVLFLCALVAMPALAGDKMAKLRETIESISAELEKATIEISEDESVSMEPEDPTGKVELSHEELKEYLRKLNPEDFGRFTP